MWKLLAVLSNFTRPICIVVYAHLQAFTVNHSHAVSLEISPAIFLLRIFVPRKSQSALDGRSKTVLADKGGS